MKSIQIRSFLWSTFSRIRTEYGEILHISLYSVRMRENADQNNSEYTGTFYTVSEKEKKNEDEKIWRATRLKRNS